MNSFTGRYSQADYRQINAFRGFKSSSTRDASGDLSDADKYKLLNVRERTQIIELLKHAIRKEYFYPIVYMVNSRGDFKLSQSNLSDASKRLFGFDIGQVVNLSEIDVKNKTYYDQALFDFLELLLLFVLPSRYENLTKRIQQIFEEKGAPFVLRGHLVIAKNVGGLASLTPLMKDRLLKSKLEKLLSASTEDVDDIALATISAEIVQNIYSSEKKEDTRTDSEKLCENVARRWTDEEKVDELKSIINDTVLIAKRWNNSISDVRHTDKSTIYVSSPSVYKMIYGINESIAEFTISTMQDTFMSEQSLEEIVINYSKDWDVDLNVSEKEDESDRPIDLSEIPF